MPVFSCIRSLFRLAHGSANREDVLHHVTSSSGVAKRPRDASCLSVVSFNSTKRRVASFIVSLLLLHRLQIYHCVQLNALFGCLWRNVEASCYKHFVVFSRSQHRRLLPTGW